MSVQTLERQNKKVRTSSENRGLELVVNNEISSIGYFSINNRRYLGNKYKTKVEHIGIDNGIAADDVLIL